MKKLMMLAVAAAAFVQVNAQDFKAPLEKTFTAFDTTMDMTVKVAQSNKLGLIAKKWGDEWLTHYYNAFSKTVLSYNEKDEAKRDAYLDEAEQEKDAATSILKKETDETYVLAAMIANARLAVKPMARWQKYGKIFDENLEKAKGINADNPRIYYLKAMSLYYKPKAFGGGKKAALPYLQKADGLFAKETGDDIAKPYWGKRMNTYMLAQANGEEKE